MIRGFINIYNQPELALFSSELAYVREGGLELAYRFERSGK
jgi:hypothetical protein